MGATRESSWSARSFAAGVVEAGLGGRRLLRRVGEGVAGDQQQRAQQGQKERQMARISRDFMNLSTPVGRLFRTFTAKMRMGGRGNSFFMATSRGGGSDGRTGRRRRSALLERHGQAAAIEIAHRLQRGIRPLIDIVGEDQAARPHKRQELVQIVDITVLVAASYSKVASLPPRFLKGHGEPEAGDAGGGPELYEQLLAPVVSARRRRRRPSPVGTLSQASDWRAFSMTVRMRRSASELGLGSVSGGRRREGLGCVGRPRGTRGWREEQA